MFGGQRFGFEHVERGAAQGAAVESGDQCVFDDDLPARDVDQLGAAGEFGQQVGVEQVARLCGQRQHDGEDLGGFQHAGQRFHSGKAVDALDEAGRAGPPGDGEAQAGQFGGGDRAQFAEAEHGDADLVQLARVDEAPLAAALRGFEFGDIAGVAESGEEDVVGHHAGHVGVEQAADRDGGQVVAAEQGVDAGAEVHHEAEVAVAGEEARWWVPDEGVMDLVGVAAVVLEKGEVGQVFGHGGAPGDRVVETAVEEQGGFGHCAASRFDMAESASS